MRKIVYHANCHDGITALWVAMQRWPHGVPVKGVYGIDPVPVESFTGDDVVFVDFSYRRDHMLAIAAAAASLQVYDHHKTAEAELDGLGFCVFDMERSGAGLAWDELMPGRRPPLVDYVEDRDLWRFSLPQCKEVHAACNSYPVTLEHRDILMRQPIVDLQREGEAILRYHNKLVQSALQSVRRTKEVTGDFVPVITCPNIELVSDLGHEMAKGQPYAAIVIHGPDRTTVSLRSEPGGVDVSEIAKKRGGGGHKHAAGFTL